MAQGSDHDRKACRDYAWPSLRDRSAGPRGSGPGSVTTDGATGRPLLVLDTPPFNHFALADRLDVFRDLLIDWEPWSTTVRPEPSYEKRPCSRLLSYGRPPLLPTTMTRSASPNDMVSMSTERCGSWLQP